AGYDTVRYLEGGKLASPPPDDRQLPDLHMQLYRETVAFDHVQKTVLLITHVQLDDSQPLRQAYDAAVARLEKLVQRIETPFANQQPELAVGVVDLDTPAPRLPVSSMGQGGYQQAVLKAKQYIAAGDIFQV